MEKNDRRKALEAAKSELQSAEYKLAAARRRVQELEDAIEREDRITKRDVAQGVWIAPVVMAVNLPTSVFAQGRKARLQRRHPHCPRQFRPRQFRPRQFRPRQFRLLRRPPLRLASE